MTEEETTPAFTEEQAEILGLMYETPSHATLTAKGSVNHALWTRWYERGWMARVNLPEALMKPPLDEMAKLLGLEAFTLTERGRRAVAKMNLPKPEKATKAEPIPGVAMGMSAPTAKYAKAWNDEKGGGHG